MTTAYYAGIMHFLLDMKFTMKKLVQIWRPGLQFPQKQLAAQQHCSL